MVVFDHDFNKAHCRGVAHSHAAFVRRFEQSDPSYDVVTFVNTNVVHCAVCGSADNSPVTLYFDVTVPEQYAEKSLSR